jgi:hypothetical protein
MDYKDPGVWIDVSTEFFFNGANFMMGYTLANGQVITPTKGAWTVAILTGIIGSMNHLRALRKVTSA